MIGLAAGSGVGLAIGAYVAYRANQNHQLERLQVFRDRRTAILRDVVYKTGSVNALVLKIHNGGSKLTEGTPWYSSVVAEAPTFADVSAIDVWQNKDVDSEYKELIRIVRRNKVHWLVTDGMADSFLKRTYKRMGVVGSIVMEVYQDENFYYYVSFPARDDYDLMLKGSELNKYEVAQIHLARLYKKYHDLGVLEIDWLFPDGKAA